LSMMEGEEIRAGLSRHFGNKRGLVIAKVTVRHYVAPECAPPIRYEAVPPDSKSASSRGSEPPLLLLLVEGDGDSAHPRLLRHAREL
jgi:hypothetical protein